MSTYTVVLTDREEKIMEKDMEARELTDKSDYIQKNVSRHLEGIEFALTMLGMLKK